MPAVADTASPSIEALHADVLTWFAMHARDLPWRSDPQPWAVMVSEFMLQQTPVSRVLPMFEIWLDRWPTPSALAQETPGEAVRAWGRLGYPRRALRLHASARVIVEQHDGKVPSDINDLKALPGVGDYTAAAIASFAFGQSHVVLDTNVRRVFARTVRGVEFPDNSVSAIERELAARLLPQEDAARWAAGTMELGALVCTAKSPACDACPIDDQCSWNLAGRPAHSGAPRRGQSYDGTDRQVRGRLLSVLRDTDGPVSKAFLDAVWSDAAQRERCLESLIKDGLVEVASNGTFRLPS